MLKFSADNGPIQIKSDSLNLDYKANSVEFIGNVHAAQSGTTLTSKSLKVLYGEKFGDIKEGHRDRRRQDDAGRALGHRSARGLG